MVHSLQWIVQVASDQEDTDVLCFVCVCVILYNACCCCNERQGCVSGRCKFECLHHDDTMESQSNCRKHVDVYMYVCVYA
jgi:hypothetical protein